MARAGFWRSCGRNTRDLSPAGDSLVRQAATRIVGFTRWMRLTPSALGPHKQRTPRTKKRPGDSPGLVRHQHFFRRGFLASTLRRPKPRIFPSPSGSVVDLRHRLDFFGLIDELVREISGGDGVSRRARSTRARNTGGRFRRRQQDGCARGADREHGDCEQEGAEESGLAVGILTVVHRGLLVVCGPAELALPMETTLKF